MFNMAKYIKDYEIEGDIPKFTKVCNDVTKIVLPAMIEGFLVALVGLFDGIMVSGLGNNYTAAINITKQPIFFMICFITALNIAVTTIVARRRGEKDVDGCNNTIHTALILSFILSIILSIIVFFSGRYINMLMGAQADTIDLATSYLKIIAAGFVFNALRLTMNACQRGLGKTSYSMVTNIVANLVNVFLNYILIYGNLGAPKMGIEGAALATVVGQGVAFLICLVSMLVGTEYLRLHIKKLFIRKENISDIWKLFPSAMIEQALMRVGFILFALIVNNLGTNATYVHGVCSDINSLMFTIADGFAIGTSAIVGHRLGEKRKDLAIVYAKVSMMLSFAVAIIIALIMVFLRGPLVELYQPRTEELFHQCKTIMLIGAITTLPQNIQWVLTGILRGSGDTKFTAFSSFVSVTLVRPIISFCLCYLTPLGIIGAWIGMFIDQGMRLGANIWRFKSRAWIRMDI